MKKKIIFKTYLKILKTILDSQINFYFTKQFLKIVLKNYFLITILKNRYQITPN